MLYSEISIKPRRRRSGWLALGCGVGLLAPGVAGEGSSDLARAELARRSAAAAEAQELLKNGDAAYEKGDFSVAREAYRGALGLLPAGAPAVAQMREFAAERYAQAAVEVAREQRRGGDVAAATATIDEVLDEDMAPDDFRALEMQEQILDPIRTNPAGSAAHTADIDEVRRLLYTAEGAFNLGDYDKSLAVYSDVLRTDPYNKAARRGMERAAAAKSDYFRAAYNETRATMLGQIDAGWELMPPMSADFPVGVEMDFRASDGVDYLTKMRQMTIPVISLEDVNIVDAMDFLRQQAISLDEFESDPLKRGINFVLDLGGADSEMGREIRGIRFNLNLRNVPFDQALEYITNATRTTAVPQPFAVMIRPAAADSADMINKSYRVPPDFLTAGASDEGEGGVAAADPFAPAEEPGLFARRLSAQEILRNRGVTFPEGASASFSAASSTLRVRNTVQNHSVIEQIVEALTQTEPTAVIVEVRVLKAEQTILEELGFDWLLTDFSLGIGQGLNDYSSLFAGGGTTGNTGEFGEFLGPVGAGPVTAGNRSGSKALTSSSIDEVIANRDRVAPALRAPGVLSVNGALRDGAVSFLMRGLDQKTGVDLAAVPSVTTRSGQAASVRVIREFIFPTEYEPPELPNSVGNTDGIVLVDLETGEVDDGGGGRGFPVTPATPTSFEMREIGIILDVLPTVSKDRRFVDLSVSPNVSEFDGFINYGAPILDQDQVITENSILMPVFSRMQTTSAVTIADGATLVLGGLLSESNETVDDKTPILGDLPVVGRLFQSKVSKPVRTSLVFLVTVKVVDAAGRRFNP